MQWKEIIKIKANDSEIVATQLCLRDISKKFSTANMKKKQRNRLVGSVFEFSGDYVIAVIDILGI